MILHEAERLGSEPTPKHADRIERDGRSEALRFALLCVVLFLLCSRTTAQVRVRYTEGLVHGFLVLRTLDGETLAHGDLIQVAHGDRVTSRLVFHFKDGSVHDETAVYSQRRYFRLLSDHLIQQGPSFSHPEDVLIDGSSGQVTARSSGEDGEKKVKTEHMKVMPDLANGILLTLLKNVTPESPPTRASMVATTPEPKLVKLAISAQGEDTFMFGSEKRKATHYVVKIELEGITGLVAPLFGKQPPDIHFWILGGDAPAFVKSEGPLYPGGPVWRIELESPLWPRAITEGSRLK